MLAQNSFAPRPKTTGVIVLVDNRNSSQNIHKGNTVDFRGSAFKQTQVDPLQPKPDMNFGDEGQPLLSVLKQKLAILQQRVQRLEIQNKKDDRYHFASERDQKKKRRKFSQLLRQHRCPWQECQKIYGSETSLKNHLKLKHGSKKPNY